MTKKHKESTADKANKYPKLKELLEFLKNNYWDIFPSLHEGTPGLATPADVRNQLLLIHDSRLYSTPLKPVHSEHGPDVDVLAERALKVVKEHYERECGENKNFSGMLVQHVKEIYTDDVGVYSKDRRENASIPGRRFRVADLKIISDEYKRCGDWTFAEGYGRDESQAANAALEMLKLKEGKRLLWVNERFNDNQPEGVEISFFDEKQLKSIQKQMRHNNIPVPNCRKDGEPIQPELKQTESTLSMRTLWKRSPLATPTKEKKSFISESDLAAEHSSSSLLHRLGRGGSSQNSRTTSGSSTLFKKSDKDTSNAEVSKNSHGNAGESTKKGSGRDDGLELKAPERVRQTERRSKASHSVKGRAPSPYPGREGGRERGSNTVTKTIK